MSETNLKDKTVKGLSWSTIDSFASHGISFVVGVVLARLQSPDEFGVIGVAMIFVALFDKIIDCGFSNALIRKQDAKEIDYNTTFLFNIVLSAVLYVLCFIGAPYIAFFFQTPPLASVVRWISLVLIINAFAIIQRTWLVKRIDFKTQAKISVTASLLSGCVGVTMALCSYGVWSLVGQQLSRQFCNTTLLWIFNKWSPKLEFSRKSFHELFSYGGKLMLSGIIDTIFNELTTIFVGKIYLPATLGQYSRAKQFSSIFSSNLSTVVERVTYPVLSELQNNESHLIANYRRIMRTLALVSGVGCAIIASTAKPIVLILIGEKWTEAIVYLQLLAFVEITIPLKNVNLNLLQVYGRSDYILVLSIVKRIVELAAIYLGFISMKWMLVGFALAGVMGLLLNAFFTMKTCGYTLLQQIKDLWPSLTLCSFVGIVMYIVSILVSNIYSCFVLQLFFGIILFISFLEFFKLDEYCLIKKLVKEYCVKPIKSKYSYESNKNF